MRIHSTRPGAGAAASVVLLAVVLSAVAAWPVSAAAEGALAVGAPADVAHQGFAYAIITDARNADDASTSALGACRAAHGAQAAARDVCKVVQTLHEQCAAVAMDPDAGTPGVGWGIGYDKAGAEKQALEACYQTAGADRVAFCKVAGSACDTAVFREPGE